MREHSGNGPALLSETFPRWLELHRLLQLMPVGVVFVNATGSICGVSMAAAATLGHPVEALLKQPFTKFIDKHHRDAWRRHLFKVTSGRSDYLALRLSRAHGDFLPVTLESMPLSGPEGRPWGMLVHIAHTGEPARIEDERTIVHRAFQSTSEGVVITDAANRVIYVNEGYCRASGYTRRDLLGASPPMLQPEGRDEEPYQQMQDTLKRTGAWQGQVWSRRRNGEIYPEWVNITVVHDADGKVQHRVMVYTESGPGAREEMQRTLHQLAFYDTLTGLPNRQLFKDRLGQAIASAERAKQRIGVMFLDLDRFKLINDTLGHKAGDEVLIQMGQRLQRCLRDSDTVARMGGDEFTVLVGGLRSRTHSVLLANKILDSFRLPFELGGGQYYLGTSIGVSHYPEDGDDPDTLIKNADAAMYYAKEQGGNSYYLYQGSVALQAAQKLDSENALREALELGQFGLVYQPQIEVASGRIRGVEALLRWHHPVRGLVSPAEFLPLAEETGLIGPIGRWVFAEACRELKRWKALGIDGIRLAVNISPHQFLDKTLTQNLAQLAASIGVSPYDLDLEITESAAMPNLEYSVGVLQQLREQGFRVTIDDFGTGFSSLSQLKHLPITSLKVDKSFVSEIPHNAPDCAIAATIIRLALQLELEVVAEGVEYQAQLDMLQAEGCQMVQGYLFAAAMTGDEIVALLTRGEPLRPLE